VEIYLISNKNNINNIKVKNWSNKIQFPKKISTCIEHSIEILRKEVMREHLAIKNFNDNVNLANNNLKKIEKLEESTIRRISKTEKNIHSYNEQLKEAKINSFIDELEKLKDSKQLLSNKLKKLENAINENYESLKEEEKQLDNLKKETADIYSKLSERKLKASIMDSTEFYLNFKVKEFKNHFIKSREEFLKIFRNLNLILRYLDTFDFQKIKEENLIDNLKALIYNF
jgi:chromosome segregation ATPase